jgi:hypothetical protein
MEAPIERDDDPGPQPALQMIAGAVGLACEGDACALPAAPAEADSAPSAGAPL